jgi:hypothetical protein
MVIDQGLIVQMLQDGMVLFHEIEGKRLLRVMINHFDSINDIIIKDYSTGDEEHLA